MTRCPQCRGEMSTPLLGRRTGLWLSTCCACGFFSRTQEQPSAAVLAFDHALNREDAPEHLNTRPAFSKFNRTGAAETARNAILKRRELERLNESDGQLRRLGRDA